MAHSPRWVRRRPRRWHRAAAIAGFAALGLGLAGVVPTLFRAGADQPGVPTGQALAAVTSLGYLGFLAGPPIIGGVAQLTSLRLAAGLMVLANVLVVLLAGAARVPDSGGSAAPGSESGKPPCSNYSRAPATLIIDQVGPVDRNLRGCQVTDAYKTQADQVGEITKLVEDAQDKLDQVVRGCARSRTSSTPRA